MSPEKDAYLCEKYPKLFVERNMPMSQTCMCWGFEVGDGWFHILDKTCGLIQSHIDWNRKNRTNALKYNRALKKALSGDVTALEKHYSGKHLSTDWASTRAKEDLKEGKMREVSEVCSQVVVQQVKEKFGTLRFYYSGGDEYISGIVSMAEAMTEVTCEECGAPGKSNGGGWIRVTCEEHAKK
jgi:hypothetical protein